MQWNIIFIILAVVSGAIGLWQLFESRRGSKLIELKAALPPDISKYWANKDEHGGLYFQYILTGRADVPIKLQKITLQPWDKNNPKIKYLSIEENLSGDLANGVKLHKTLYCPRDRFEVDKNDTSKLNEFGFFNTVAGELCLHYLDFKGNPQRKCITIEELW